MTSRWALLVEDQRDYAVQVIEILEKQGFEVTLLENLDAVRSALLSPGELERYQIVVMDRSIPETEDGDPDPKYGDLAFADLYRAMTDAAFVILSAFADVDQVDGANEIEVRYFLAAPGVRLAGVHPFKKSRLDRFSGHISMVAEALQVVDDTELVTTSVDLDEFQQRLLKLFGRHFDAVSVEFVPISGGLSGAVVGVATARAPDNIVRAKYLVKIAQLPFRANTGGIASLLPTDYVASLVGTISGLSARQGLSYFGLAGGEARSLSDLAHEDPREGQQILSKLVGAYTRDVIGVPEVSSLESIIAPVADWPLVVKTLDALGLSHLSGSKQISINRAPQHGDLHSGNVLCSGDRPLLIDFDRQREASAVLDPVWHVVGSFFQRESPLRSSPETGDDLVGAIKEPGLVDPDTWLGEGVRWIASASESENEIWAIVLGVCVRFLGYEDVHDHAATRERAETLARHAHAVLSR